MIRTMNLLRVRVICPNFTGIEESLSHDIYFPSFVVHDHYLRNRDHLKINSNLKSFLIIV